MGTYGKFKFYTNMVQQLDFFENFPPMKFQARTYVNIERDINSFDNSTILGALYRDHSQQVDGLQDTLQTETSMGF